MPAGRAAQLLHDSTPPDAGAPVVATVLTALVVALGAALVAVGVVLVRRTRRARGRTARLHQLGVEVMGLVADDRIVRRGTSPDRAGQVDWYQPVVRFRTRDGAEVVAIGQEVARSSWIVGTPVRLRYDPQDPEEITVVSGAGLTPSPRPLAVGVACAVSGLALAVLALLARVGTFD